MAVLAILQADARVAARLSGALSADHTVVVCPTWDELGRVLIQEPCDGCLVDAEHPSRDAATREIAGLRERFPGLAIVACIEVQHGQGYFDLGEIGVDGILPSGSLQHARVRSIIDDALATARAARIARALRSRYAAPGPDAIEWEVISTYKTIESMTSTEPGDEAVDRALVELWSYAKGHPGNPFIQEMQLKGLRVAQYWAFQDGDLVRASLLRSRFENQATEAMVHDLTVREAMRMLAQGIEQTCDDAAENVQELRRLSLLFPNERAAELLRTGVESALACVVDAANR